MRKIKWEIPRDVLKPYERVFDGDKTPIYAKMIESLSGLLMGISNEQNILMLTPVDFKHLDAESKELRKVYSKSIVENDKVKPLKFLESEMSEYFIGNLMEFKVTLEIIEMGTEYQRQVWKEIYKIEYGETSTYSELAQRIGKPKIFRAIANACGRNPISIVILWHLVLAANNVTTHYSWGIE